MCSSSSSSNTYNCSSSSSSSSTLILKQTPSTSIIPPSPPLTTLKTNGCVFRLLEIVFFVLNFYAALFTKNTKAVLEDSVLNSLNLQMMSPPESASVVAPGLYPNPLTLLQEISNNYTAVIPYIVSTFPPYQRPIVYRPDWLLEMPTALGQIGYGHIYSPYCNVRAAS